MNKEIFKKVATEFFYHWWNAVRKGNNTSEVFDKWWEDKGQELVKNYSIHEDKNEQLKYFMLFIQENSPNYRIKQLKPDQVIKAYLESL